MKKGIVMQRNSDELLAFIFERIGKIAMLNDNEKLLLELAKMGRDIVFADRCTIWILDKEKKQLWSKVSHGMKPVFIPSESGIVGASLKEGKPIILNDVYSDERFNHDIDEASGYKTNMMMVIPMHNRENKVVGAIQVINKKDNGVFTQKDLDHLMLASTYISETIKSTFLLEEIDATQREILHIIGIMGESRSEETALHVKRVSKYAYLLAKEYGLSEEMCTTVRDVSPLHDIGKIAIADAVLKKPGRLDTEEKTSMMTHAEQGYNMLKDSKRELLQAAATVAYEHHEKYDGSGYPRQLKGEEIHIFGRIVALADVFDALCSSRVYKKAWEPADVQALIEEGRGKHFDPKLVDIFMAKRAEFFDIAETWKDVHDEA